MASSSSVAMTSDAALPSAGRTTRTTRTGARGRIGEFLLHISKTDSALSTKWGQDWAAVPEEHAAGIDLYGHGAT